MTQPTDEDRLHLVVTVRNLVAGTIREEWFSRSPVTVGRRDDSKLQLEAESVSVRHGVFMFGPGSAAQYVDFGSTNGSLVDGARTEPNVPVTLLDRSVVGVAPFLLIVRTELAPPRDPADDADTRTPITPKENPMAEDEATGAAPLGSQHLRRPHPA